MEDLPFTMFRKIPITPEEVPTIRHPLLPPRILLRILLLRILLLRILPRQARVLLQAVRHVVLAIRINASRTEVNVLRVPRVLRINWDREEHTVRPAPPAFLTSNNTHVVFQQKHCVCYRGILRRTL